MVNESVMPVSGGSLFLRYNEIQSGRPTLLFLHGLGESGLSFQEAFDCRELGSFNLLVPDLLGFGRSTAADHHDYRFTEQIERLREVLEQVGIDHVALVGHSMGGDLATLMASDENRSIAVTHLINIEGNITFKDLFISSRAVAADDRATFGNWLEDEFKVDLVLRKWGDGRPSCRRYFASLCFCRPEAFLASARELCRYNLDIPGFPETALGKRYSELTLPRLYCWGSESVSCETLSFLRKAQLRDVGFPKVSHWPMIDKAADFYPFLADYLARPLPW
jgi:pimeloyl-ACP methyl ester carboxylesterase